MRRVQVPSQEDRILQELEDIAFGSTTAMARPKALELLGKVVRLFRSQKMPEVERYEEEITTETHEMLEALFEWLSAWLGLISSE